MWSITCSLCVCVCALGSTCCCCCCTFSSFSLKELKRHCAALHCTYTLGALCVCTCCNKVCRAEMFLFFFLACVYTAGVVVVGIALHRWRASINLRWKSKADAVRPCRIVRQRYLTSSVVVVALLLLLSWPARALVCHFLILKSLPSRFTRNHGRRSPLDWQHGSVGIHRASRRPLKQKKNPNHLTHPIASHRKSSCTVVPSWSWSCTARWSWFY